MNKRELNLDDLDEISCIIAKLSAVHDLFQGFDFEKNSFLKRTPEGLTLIIGECITILSKIGGFNEQPAG